MKIEKRAHPRRGSCRRLDSFFEPKKPNTFAFLSKNPGWFFGALRAPRSHEIRPQACKHATVLVFLWNFTFLQHPFPINHQLQKSHLKFGPICLGMSPNHREATASHQSKRKSLAQGNACRSLCSLLTLGQFLQNSVRKR